MPTDLKEKPTITINGVDFDNPLAKDTYPRRYFIHGNQDSRNTFKVIWVERYVYKDGKVDDYESRELRLVSNGKAFLDGEKIKDPDELKLVAAVFDGIEHMNLV